MYIYASVEFYLLTSIENAPIHSHYMSRKTKDEAAKTRETILMAALDVFIEKGVSRTSLQDIAKASGVTRGAVYHHFENKSALLGELLESVRLPLDAVWMQILSSNIEDPLKKLTECLVSTFERLVNDPNAKRIHKVLLYRCEYNEELSTVLNQESSRTQQILESIQDLLECASQKQLLKPDIPMEDAAKALFCISTGLYKSYVNLNWKTDLVVTIRFAVETFLNGMRR